MLFNFLWPGAGHLYAGTRTTFGIIFVCIGVLMFLISLTIIGLVITIPAWLAMAIYSMIDVNRRIKERNAALGYIDADQLIGQRTPIR